LECDIEWSLDWEWETGWKIEEHEKKNKFDLLNFSFILFCLLIQRRFIFEYPQFLCNLRAFSRKSITNSIVRLTTDGASLQTKSGTSPGVIAPYTAGATYRFRFHRL
jgi:hypothetical protein